MISEKGRKLREESRAWKMCGMLFATGVPILKTLEIVGDTCPSLKEAFQIIWNAIREGGSMFDGVNKCKANFACFVPAMINAGEQSGDLDRTLIRLADLLMLLSRAECSYPPEPPDPKQVSTALDYEMLATFMDAHIPLLESLRFLSEWASSPNCLAFGLVANQVEKGATLAEAMRASPDNFPAYIISLVEAGEAGGVLDTVCSRIAADLNEEAFGA